MKIFSRILNLCSAVLLALIGVAFCFIEGCLIFSGDFLLFESPILAFLQMLFRFGLAAGAVALGVLVIVKKEKSFLYEGLVALVCAIIMAPFLTNGFGLYFSLIAGAFCLSNSLYKKAGK